MSKETQSRILECLRKSPDGLTGPQLHSLVPGTWDEIKIALGELIFCGDIEMADTPFSTPQYPGWRLKTLRLEAMRNEAAAVARWDPPVEPASSLAHHVLALLDYIEGDSEES